MVRTATVFSPPRARRRGDVAIPEPNQDGSRGRNRPAAELLPELDAELRRLAAAVGSTGFRSSTPPAADRARGPI